MLSADPTAAPFPPERRPFAAGPTARFALCVIALMTVGVLLVGLLYALAADLLVLRYDLRVQPQRAALLRAMTHGSNLFAVQAIGDAVAALFVARRLPALAGSLRGRLKFRRPTLRDARLAVGGVVVAYVGAAVVGSLVERLGHVDAQQRVVRALLDFRGVDVAVATLAAVVVAPVAEELIFRAFLYNALRARIGVRGAIVASALIFALAHGELNAVPALLAPGLVFAWIYERADSLWANVAAHALFNAGGFVAIFLFRQTH